MGLLSKVSRKVTKAFKNATLALEQINIFKATKTGLKNVDDVVGNLDLISKNGKVVLRGSDLPYSKLDTALRKGKFSEFAKLGTGVDIPKSFDVNFQKAIVPDVPDVELGKIADKVSINKVTTPELDLNVNSFADSKAFEKGLTPKGKSMLDSAFQKIKIAAGTTLIIGGVVFVMDLGKTVYDSIYDSMESGNGCYLVKKVNGKTTSCKLTNRTCNSKNNDGNVCQELPPIKFNIALTIMDAIEKKDTTTLGELKTAIGQDVTNDNLPQILSNTSLLEKLITWYDGINNTTLSSICTLKHAGIEGGVIPVCRACNPSADVTSTTYVDISELADNYSLTCQTNTTPIDVLSDMGFEYGQDFLNSVAGSFGLDSGMIKNFVIGIVVIMVIAVVIGLVLKFSKKSKTGQT